MSDFVISRFGDALGQFAPTCSLIDASEDWLHENRIHISDCVSASGKEEWAIDVANIAFPRLLVYTVAHLTLFCPRFLESLRRQAEQWSKPPSAVAHIVDYRANNDVLQEYLHRCEEAHFHDTQTKIRIERIMKLDILCLAAQLSTVLGDFEQRNLLLNQQGQSAQSLLNLLQELLDRPYLSGSRVGVLRTIVGLSTKCGLYPECLVLRGVNIRGQNPVGGGTFGDIYKSKVADQTIAVKLMRVYDPNAVEMAIKIFSREAVIWRQLSHPNLLPFYGVYRSSGTVPRVCLVSPWMQNGNIIQYLEKAPTATRRPLITDVAEGLHYLHTFEPPVIHGDLKGANIFITPSLRACVADFGLTSLESDSQGSLASTSTTSGIGSLLWTAPELLNYRTGERQRQTLTTDMYSFGCVCYEIYTGSPKFASLSVTRIILAVTEGRPVPRPPHPELDETTWDIIQQCWSLVPNSRPTTLEVIQMLSTDTISTTRKEPISEWNEDMMWQLHSKFEGNSSDTIASSGRYSRNLTESLRSYSQQSQDSASVMTQTTSSNSLRDFTTNSHWENRSGMITSHDMIIAVMGPTGTGKSTFIDEATRGQGPVIGHSLDSCTRYVQTFTYTHPRQHGRNVVFVDTPGFDDSQRTDYEILEEIAKWLETTYKQRITLSGLLYFHAISDSRMRGAPLRNLAMFKELCGENALQNVILTTTMWDEVPTAVGVRHEEQLRDEFWEPMISAGCRMARFSRSWESAWDIIDKLDISTRQPIQLQIQMVDNGWKLHQTSAYAALARIWEDMIAKFRDLLRKKDGDPAVLRPLLRSAEGQKKALDRHSVSQASFASSVTLVMSKSHRFRTNKKT